MEGTLSGGKKWASGEGVASSSTTNFTYSDSSSVLSKSYVDITLSFKPSIIVVSSKYNRDGTEYLSILNNMGYLSSVDNVKCSMYNASVAYSSTSISFKNDEYISLGNNVYRIPLIGTYSTISNLKWIAYE